MEIVALTVKMANKATERDMLNMSLTYKDRNKDSKSQENIKEIAAKISSYIASR